MTNKGTTELVTPAFVLPAGGGVLSFQNLFNMEANATTGFDGMVLEIKINGGAFADILTAGGSFVTGGYTRTISNAFGNPLENRPAWSGLSGGTAAAPAYITTTVNLPATASGQNIQLKWRVGTDSSGVAQGVAGVRIDNIMIAPVICGPPTPHPRHQHPTPTLTQHPPTPRLIAPAWPWSKIYDLSQGAQSKLTNISTRDPSAGRVATFVIAGFVLGIAPVMIESSCAASLCLSAAGIPVSAGQSNPGASG